MNSRLSSDVKDQVKRATDIVELVGSYDALRRSGRNYVCHCPWHDDQRPSLNVDPVRQSWVCWVCNIRGDVFDFVMRRENVEFAEALRMLADRAGIRLTFGQTKVVKGSPQDKQTLYRAMTWAIGLYHSLLTESTDGALARNYLQDRGISSESVSRFQLGFAPLKFSWLADQARSSEFSMEVLAACDLLSPSDQGGGYFERFRGRLIFPIFDTSGRAIAIGGRLVPGVPLESAAKYLNSRETRLFSKSETLYGLNFVKDEVGKSRSLVVVEGYTDVIAAWQAGLRDVVACLGTAINEKHCRLIKRFADRITLVLDGDEAGRKQANNVIELFVTQDVDLRILTLPDEMDPLDFLQREGGERFRQMVGDAHDAIEHKLRTLTAGVDLLRDTHRANAALDEMLKTLSRVPASVFSTATERGLRQDQLLTRFARQFGVDIERLRVRLAELRQAVRPEPRARTPVTSGPLVDFSKLNKRESQLIQVLLNSPEHLDFVIENVAPEQFQQGPLKELYCIIEDCFQRGEAIDFQNLLLVLECPDLKCVLHHLQAEWQDMQSTADLQSIKSPRPLAAEIVDSFRQTSLDVERQKRISQLQLQKLEPEEETQTLIDLLNQTRQRHR